MNNYLEALGAVLMLILGIFIVVGIPLIIFCSVLWMLMTFWPVILVLAVIGAIAQLMSKRF